MPEFRLLSTCFVQICFRAAQHFFPFLQKLVLFQYSAFEEFKVTVELLHYEELPNFGYFRLILFKSAFKQSNSSFSSLQKLFVFAFSAFEDFTVNVKLLHYESAQISVTFD